MWAEALLASACELHSDSAGARRSPLAAIRIAGRDRRLIWIEVGPMLSEAMLGLGIDQREAVDEPSGTLRRAADVRLALAKWQPSHRLGTLARARSRSPIAARRMASSSGVSVGAKGSALARKRLSAANLGALAKREGSSRLRCRGLVSAIATGFAALNPSYAPRSSRAATTAAAERPLITSGVNLKLRRAAAVARSSRLMRNSMR